MSTAQQAAIDAVILGNSEVIRELRRRIGIVAKAPLAVLIEGPTGSGKELVAQALHSASSRSGPCVAVNVCATADTMFEDAFFGHTRGAFTGATQDHAGYLTEAHRGTIFLDEIGGLPLGAQAKLLRAIETRRFRPVGAKHDQVSDFRVVSATNISLAALSRAGSFRIDLAERLRAVRLEVPPLCAREDDVVVLANAFAVSFGVRLTSCAARIVRRQEWPGNVRQLRNAIECAAAFAGSSETIDASVISDCLSTSSSIDTLPAANPRSFRDKRLLEALAAMDGDVEKTAEKLGVHRATLYRSLRRLRHEKNLIRHPDNSLTQTSGKHDRQSLAVCSDHASMG